MKRLSAAVFILGLVLPAFLPAVCPYLPFQDWPAHVGIVGVLTHFDDPVTSAHYTYSGWFKLNMLFYLPAWALGELVGPINAANLCLAVALGALGPAMWLLCRALDADHRLALLATPLAIGRHIYCGFGPNAASLPLFVLVFALFFFIRRGVRPRAGTVALSVVLLMLAFTHAFIFLATAGLLGLLATVDAVRSPRRAGWAALLGLVVSGALFVGLFSQGIGLAGRSAGDPVSAIWQAILDAPRDKLGETFWAWLFASYRYRQLDDGLQAVWSAAVLAGLGATLLMERAWWRSGRAALAALAAVTLAMFVILPENVGPPVNWWGARLRLPPLVALLLIPTVARSVGTRVSYAISAAGVVSVLTVMLALVDLAAFHQNYTRGLSAVLEAMPRGQRISALHFTPSAIHEYPGQPFGYFGNFYIAQKGGVVPQGFFERSEVPFLRRQRQPAPPWGIASRFRWASHGSRYDGFLVRIDDDRGLAPFVGHEDDVELVIKAGGWRYYRRVSPSPP
ncbi:MAG: hypothetical protein AAF449_10075 [Myxococcota bacterium]